MVAAAVATGCEVLQIFLRPPGRWSATALPAPEVARFRAAARGAGLEEACFAHAPYLLNLASADGELRARSVAVLSEELRRAGRLGLAGVVLHPGSAGTGQRAEAEARCRAAIAEALDRAGRGAAMLLLEGTAGAGGQLGRTPAELARLVERGLRNPTLPRHAAREPGFTPGERGGLGECRGPGGRVARCGTPRERVGICLDSAHLWGAGFDLLGDGWKRALGEVAEHWGREVPHLLHGNDTQVELGSHRDRHAPPGGGLLGEAFYRRVLNDPRCAALPVVLEIPPGEDNELVSSALARLRGWQR